MKIEEGQSAFYSEHDSKIVVNIPCEILRVKRIYCEVLLFEDENSLNGCEVWEVPKEDLVPTDSFYVEYYNRIYATSVVNYSTYSREDGSGQQMVYIYREHIGDTLSIFGGLSEDVFDVIYIIID